MPIKTETELYAPVKSYFEQQGYHVRGEVHHCDLVAIREDEPPVIVELKKSFSIPLLLQGIDRLRLTRSVYVAFELPSKGRAPHGASWTELRRLCRMLGIGMITVQFYKRKKPQVQVECHPAAFKDGLPDAAAPSSPLLLEAVETAASAAELVYAAVEKAAAGTASAAALLPASEGPLTLPRPNKRAAERIVREFKERSADYNVGGSTQRKLVTSYREKALHMALLLHRNGPMSPRLLRDQTGIKNAADLLQKNYYRWFERVARGVYRLTPLGEEALLTYARVVEGLPASIGAKPASPAAAEGSANA
ncbi:hypothetical protein SK3146_05346 [Paenibacillus konkukensis]|uniref:Uncharacterized protein n=1 Tax=Paenibacillus konkukensis TaxID=2020716 RepID=A0ABY4RXC0_9BACL|nr:DUF2161 family putative PD-(D/E)XK-type phosphodiesterase [Paenibacillus konkukensis]UQZ86054.1 hypothetical protein SK3146_05346 [Paenibacillus konkukensis]